MKKLFLIIPALLLLSYQKPEKESALNKEPIKLKSGLYTGYRSGYEIAIDTGGSKPYIIKDLKTGVRCFSCETLIKVDSGFIYNATNGHKIYLRQN